MRISVEGVPFGPLVRILALERGLKMADLARMIGMDPSSIFRAVMNPSRKQHRPPSLKMLMGIDQALNAIKPLSPEERTLLFLKGGYLPPFENKIVHSKDNTVYVSFYLDRPLRKEVNSEPIGFA
jgi:transcriptional regulator with XRE-family HTH domain